MAEKPHELNDNTYLNTTECTDLTQTSCNVNENNYGGDDIDICLG